MTVRLVLVPSALGLLAGALAANSASAQYYYGPGYGYGPPPGPYSYNGPPPREYGRPYEGDYGAPHPPRPLSARAVIDRLEAMGYARIGVPRFTGTLYIVQAVGPGGVHQQVVVDAIRGVILNTTAMAGPPEYGPDPGAPPPRRYGGRPLDTEDLRRRPPPRREAARPPPLDSGPGYPPPEGSEAGMLPPPADPQLDPGAQPPMHAAPRPFEGHANRQARTEPKRTREPVETGARPFGLNPAPGVAGKGKDGDVKKAAQPPAAPKKPVAEARPQPEKPIRVIQGVTPLNTGESRSQLDSLPQPPDPPAPTGQ